MATLAPPADISREATTETTWQQILSSLEPHFPGITAMDASARNRCIIDGIKADWRAPERVT